MHVRFLSGKSKIDDLEFDVLPLHNSYFPVGQSINMSRQYTPNQGYPQHRQQKPQKSNVIWFVLGGVALFLFVLIAGLTAYFVFARGTGEGIANSNSNSAVPEANVPSAVNDVELQRMVKDINRGSLFSKEPIQLPNSIEQAVKFLELPTDSGITSRTRNQSQKQIAAEWLFNRDPDPTYRPRAAKALAESYHGESKDELKKSVAKAFRTWGDSDHVHLFIENYTRDSMVPGLLEVLGAYPTRAGTEKAIGYLSTSYGDAAKKILINMDNEHAKLLIPVYDSGKTSAADRVKEIFAEWDIDIEKTRLEYYVGVAAGGKHGAWEMVANIPLDQESQPMVIDGLRRFDRKDFRSDDWLDACIIWGNSSLLPLIHEVFASNYSFNRDKALQFIKKYPDESSVPFLVDRLLQKWSSEADQISAALLSLYKEDLGIDYEEEVHRPLVLRYNDFGMFQLSAMKSLLQTTEFDTNLLLDQCLKDIRDDRSRSRAFEHLASMEVIEKRRYEVAEAIAEIIAGGSYATRSDETFLHWATPENQYLYDLLNDTFGGDKWKMALRIALQGDNNTDRIIVPVARALGDTFKGDELVDVMTQNAEQAEPLMLKILGSDNEKELIGACYILRFVGTEKAVPPLRELMKTAKRLKNEPVYDAVVASGRAITERVGEDKIKAYEAELEQEAEGDGN